MGLEFELHIDYGLAELLALNRTVLRLYRRWRVFFVRIICFLAGLTQLLAGGLLLWSDGFNTVSVVNLLLAVIFLGLSLFYLQLNAWGSKRMLLKDTGTITVTVNSDGIRECSRKGESRYPYSAITDLCLCRGCYVLLLDKRHGIALSQAALVSGDWEELGKYLSAQCGKELREIR